VRSTRARDWLRKQAPKPRKDFKTVFPSTSDEGRDLLAKMLEFDPEKRISVDEALAHPYMASLHSPDDEPSCPTLFDFSFEKAVKTESDIRLEIFASSCEFHTELLPELEAGKAVAAKASAATSSG
jgi:serine/threonine protein kinase